MRRFECTSPCGNCPYRTDSPLRHWPKEEFALLLANEASELGKSYSCHKQNGSVCVGFLMNQDERRFPSIMLRLDLIQNNVGRDYLDRLACPVPLFESVEEMVGANYPELLEK